MEFSVETAKLGGSYEVDAVYTLEVFLDPCEAINPGDCEVMWKGAPASTLDDLAIISEYLNDFSMQIGYIEDTVDISNFENPISRNFVWRPKTSFHSQ